MAYRVNLPVLGKEMVVNIVDAEEAVQLALAYQKRKVTKRKLVLYGGSLTIHGNFVQLFFKPKTFTEDQREAVTKWFNQQDGSAYFVYR